MIDTQAYFCYNPDRLIVLTPLHQTMTSKAALSTIDEHFESSDESNDTSDDELCRRSSRPGLWPMQAERKNNKRVPPLTEEQLMLCDFMVKGYSLRNKRWLYFFVDSIEDIEWRDNAWDSFVATEDHKDLILSLAEGRQCEDHDLRSGGRNVILTGSTGVGKTMAVELAAEALHAPLFNITLADIELEPKDPDLDSPFTDVLNMCSRWKAIVLMDGLDSSSADDFDSQETCE